jgi:polar amino acid transport system substrate-binding protein
VAEKLNLTVKFESLPWRRGLFDFKQGKYDAMTYVSHTEERAKFAYFLKGNILSTAKTYPIVLAHRKTEMIYDGDLTSLTNYMIGVGKGYKYGEPFDSAKFLSKYEIPTPSQEVLTQLLYLERVDVILSSKRSLLQIHSQKEIDELYYIFEQPVASNNSYLVFSKVKDKLAIAREFAKALNHYKSSSAYTKLLQHYKNKENNQK